MLAAPASLLELQRPAALTAPHHALDSRTNIKLNYAVLDRLKKGDTFNISLPDQREVSTTIVKMAEAMDGVEDKRTVLSIQDGTGMLEIIHQSSGGNKVRVVDTLGRIKIYEASLGADGEGELLKINPHTEFCIDMPVESLSSIQSQKLVIAQGSTPLNESQLRALQSKPNAEDVIFINYWGGTLSDTSWNYQDNGGDDIVYSPYSLDDTSNQFTQTERDLMWLGWRETAEDYAPFEVNITTDLSIYDATPVAHRAMLIVTTTTAWYEGSAGGVAFLGGFGSADFSAGWVWNRGEASLGQTISHEAGHMIGLSHDGNNNSSYETGHGSWGPIMGAAFGKTYTQWSRGEYPNANNTEDDLQIISNLLGEDTDFIGDSLATAMAVSSSVHIEGTIEPDGLQGGMDTDVYSFHLSATQDVTIEVAPLLALEAEKYGTNLSLDAVLSDGVTVIAESSLTANPISNVLSFHGSLDAGTYYLIISGQTPDASWTTGFGEYANAGIYSVSIDSGVAEPDLVANFTIDKTELIIGETVAVNAMVQDIGAASSSATIARFYQSADDIITTGDHQVAAHNVNALASLSIDSIDTQITMPNIAGSYYFGVCVDTVWDETVIANNCSAATAVNVNDLDIGNAVEQPDLNWSNAGDSTFFRQTKTSVQQGDAAQSGRIQDNQRSYIEINTSGPGVIKFQWKVSSEEGFDFLKFTDNGQQVDAISGEVDWTQVTVSLGAGQHLLRWEYAKDEFIMLGDDAGWVDKVEFVDRQFEISSFSAAQAEGDTGETSYQYTVKSNGPSTSSASVAYQVTGSGTQAANAADFGGVFPQGVVHFAVGETSKLVRVYVSGDKDLEASEGFTLRLSNPQGGILGDVHTVFSTILNDELDFDSDGITDTDDNCPLHANTDQRDSDGDLLGDACDTDRDGDGVDNDVDNCPTDANPDQKDICTLCFPIPAGAGVVMICL